LKWVRMYAENADAGLTCRRCGISRPTLRLGARRYSAQGEVGLHSHSPPAEQPSTASLCS
jgi:hypothetical protein